MTVTTADIGHRATYGRTYGRRHRKADLGGTERLVSVVAGSALACGGLRYRGPAGVGMIVLGGLLALRGATGHSMLYDLLGLSPDEAERETAIARGWSGAVNVRRSVTIARPREELYRFFRDFGNLPHIMTHVRSVTELSPSRSHWVIEAPGGRTVEWDSEIEDEREGERIAWRSLPGAAVRNAGSIGFKDAPGDRGTELTLSFSYEPPAGPLGRAVALLFHRAPEQQAQDDLRRFKQVMEAGEVATIKGQSSGRR